MQSNKHKRSVNLAQGGSEACEILPDRMVVPRAADATAPAPAGRAARSR